MNNHLPTPIATSFADDLRRLADLARTLADEANRQQGHCPLCTRSHSTAVTADYVRSIYRMRRLRDAYLPADLFADPAWDMLLDLTLARLAGTEVSASSLCIAAAVPTTTGLRWIKLLVDRGLIVREPDPHDARRALIHIADCSLKAMLDYLSKVRQLSGQVI